MLFRSVKESKNTSDLQASLSFQGKSQSLQFVSSFPASVGRLGLQLFSIELKKEDDEQIIKVTITPFFSTESNQDQKEEVVLLKKVGDFAFSYFGSDDLGDTSSGSWHDEWLDKNALPQLVKITIKQDNEKEIPWSDMLIALKITGKNDVQNQVVSSTATEK